MDLIVEISMRIRWCVIFSLLFFLSACGGEPAENPDFNTGTNGSSDNDGGGDSDAGDGGGDAGDGETGEGDGDGEGGEGDGEGETCVPLAVCEVSMCGEIDDGCDGVLQCDPCLCVDGAPQAESCGTCDLGRLSCATGETGQGQCSQVEIPGLTNCQNLVYVDALEGRATASGTIEDPLNSLADGINLARSSGAAAVLIGGDRHTTYEGPFLLDSAISLVGGFGEDFEPIQDRPRIVSSSRPSGYPQSDIFGITVTGVQAPIVLANLIIETEDVEAESGSNYGLYVRDSPQLRLVNIRASAGRGGEGRRGSNGLKGNNGQNGENAIFEIVATTTVTNQLANFYVNELDFAQGGQNSSCPIAFGGRGGGGGLPTADGVSALWTPLSGSPGHAEIARRGSPGDINGSHAGGNGENAPPAEDGEHGLGGVSLGEITNGFWQQMGAGDDGIDGEHGTGGGGGGGGASNGNNSYTIGSFGGAGGAGGCGGVGGQGGGGGGGSFGLFVISSDLIIENSRFFASQGGRGGAGGLGGQGGDAGSGGVATFRFRRTVSPTGTFTYGNLNARGGTGGKGADGGQGGDGGGGAGGASYGAYCHDSSLETIGDVRFTSDAAAPGGASPTNPGATGVSESSYRCD